jgi:hypothetical protein
MIVLDSGKGGITNSRGGGSDGERLKCDHLSISKDRRADNDLTFSNKPLKKDTKEGKGFKP